MGPYGAYYEYHVPVSSDIICIRTYGVVLCRTGCNGGGGGGDQGANSYLESSICSISYHTGIVQLA